MLNKALNRIEKNISAQVYYQCLEKSVSGNKGCYEMTVIEGDLCGLKILWEDETPVCVYLPEDGQKVQERALSVISAMAAQPEWTDRRLPAVIPFEFGKVFAENRRRPADDYLRCRGTFLLLCCVWPEWLVFM